MSNVNGFDASVLTRRGVTRRQLVKFCSAMLATLALPEKYLGQTVAAVTKGEEAGAGVAPVSGLHRMLGVDAAVEPSGNRRHRARSVLVGIPRGHHGGRGNTCDGCARSRRKGRKRQVSGGGGGRNPDWRGRRLLHHRRPHGARNRRAGLPQRRGHHRGGSVRHRRRVHACPPQSRPARWASGKRCPASSSSI